MSTYYKLICHDHKERTDAVSRTAGGSCFLADGHRTLLPFLIAHCGCNVGIVSEHDEDYYNEDFRDWEEANVDHEILDAKRDGRWR